MAKVFDRLFALRLVEHGVAAGAFDDLADSVALADAGVDAPQNFNTVNGDVEIKLGGTTDAQVKAETLAGEIKPDDALGLKVERQMVGQHLAGQLGRGGPPLVIKTVHGDIRIKK